MEFWGEARGLRSEIVNRLYALTSYSFPGLAIWAQAAYSPLSLASPFPALPGAISPTTGFSSSRGSLLPGVGGGKQFSPPKGAASTPERQWAPRRGRLFSDATAPPPQFLSFRHSYAFALVSHRLRFRKGGCSELVLTTYCYRFPSPPSLAPGLVGPMV